MISPKMNASLLESKRLAIELRANEDEYVNGELDLNETLDKTERLWEQVPKGREVNISVSEIMPDSYLMKIQTGIVKRSARLYKPDSLIFNPVEFSKKLKLDQSPQNDLESSSGETQVWLQLGSKARTLLYAAPVFNFIYGTFDPDPVEVLKKKRKMKQKDKVGDLTKPLSMSLKENKDNKDQMIEKAGRVLGILDELLKKNPVVCFYEFVTDPSSFGRTVENIFIVSLLVNQNCVRILEDKKGLPCLKLVPEIEKQNRNPSLTKQHILTIGLTEWQNIVKTFKFKRALIPPQKPTSR